MRDIKRLYLATSAQAAVLGGVLPAPRTAQEAGKFYGILDPSHLGVVHVRSHRGVIGVGKTTLARLLQPRFEADLLLEIFEENPFLSDFYGDRQRYAFQTQIFFLLSRYRQQNSTVPKFLAEGRSLLADYTFAKDALFARINLSGDELIMYDKVHEALGEKIPKPDLVVYLQASTDVLMQRIALRDRPYERQMERNYIDRLNQAYDEFFSKPFDHTPVLTIDTNHLNIIQNAEHLTYIENRIRQSLGLLPLQPSLPLAEA